jgi:uncharacterized protein
MKVTHYDKVGDFYGRVEGYLVEHEAHHNLMLGICATLLEHPERYPHPPLLATVEEDGELLLAALRTPPHNLVVSRVVSLEAVQALARELSQRRESLPGVNGPAVEAEAFAGAWQALAGQPYHKNMALRIYQLEQVNPVTGVSGYLRKASEDDRDRLVRWRRAFMVEALGASEEDDGERAADHLLRVGGLYFWEDDGPVSMAFAGRPTPNGKGVNLVYTPPEYRKRGYASACVAGVSQAVLDEGRRYCFLFTDLANPTSNHIYQAIGYRPVCDVDEYTFEVEVQA